MVFLFGLAFLCLKPKSQAQSSTMFCVCTWWTLLVASLTLSPEEKVVTYLRPCLVRQNLASLSFPAPCLMFWLLHFSHPYVLPPTVLVGPGAALQACSDVFAGCCSMRKYVWWSNGANIICSRHSLLCMISMRTLHWSAEYVSLKNCNSSSWIGAGMGDLWICRSVTDLKKCLLILMHWREAESPICWVKMVDSWAIWMMTWPSSSC